MKIKFCGAAKSVTGSAHLITLDSGYKILLDCGLYQGYADEMKDFNSSWLFDPSELDCVILSHAHIDHSGRLPKLVKDGFKGRIYATHATRSLANIMLMDSAFIQERDAQFYNKRNEKKGKPLRTPLYERPDVKPTIEKFIGLGYESWVTISDEVKIYFTDAGHILGSASVTLKVKTKDNKWKTIGFTGDIGRPDRPILRDPQPMPDADYLICESTYGNKTHGAKPQENEKLLRIIKETCVEKKGKLIIPAFSIGRTQEIVYILDQLETAGLLPRIPVFVDSPLAVNATMVFGSHPECYDSQLHEYMLKDPNPFGFNNLEYIKDVNISKSLNGNETPCIIISSSGMMNAGRVKHHLYNNISNPKNTLLIVGYCAPNTPGGKLRAGAEELKLFQQKKQVKMNVEIMDSFSAHADRDEITDFVANHKSSASEIFLVHGEQKGSEALQKHLSNNGFRKVTVPDLGQEVKI